MSRTLDDARMPRLADKYRAEEVKVEKEKVKKKVVKNKK